MLFKLAVLQQDVEAVDDVSCPNIDTKDGQSIESIEKEFFDPHLTASAHGEPNLSPTDILLCLWNRVSAH